MKKLIVPVLIAALLAACAAPQALQAPDHEVRLTTVPAHGVQIYECRAAQAAAPAWAFVAPEAELFDGTGRRIGQHGAGPTWTHDDGSGFSATVQSRSDSPSGAIPWLLLKAKTTGSAGAFSRVTSVQRVHTVGGQAPADGCTAATLGKKARVAYRADYVLFVPRT